VPGDLSSAVFFIAAASLFPDSNLLIHNVGLNPTRTAILDIFASMGASVQMMSLRSAHGEIVGDLSVKGAPLKGGVIEGEQIPLVIDELPMLAALGPHTEQGIEIRNAAELRVKESDRIAMAFAVSALAADGPTVIRDADCAGVSYPTFFQDLDRVAER
jgi:3-phosphoshikimate 1-carboxyvinyltransferase